MYSPAPIYAKFSPIAALALGYLRTKGDPIKIGATDRTSRETLEERLDKTPSNALCFAQGSSLMY